MPGVEVSATISTQIRRCAMPSKFKEGERKQDAAPESEVVAEAWNRFATARTRSVAEERILVRLQ
jgi:hypothetical protein